jgi:hypothetical protein
VPAITDRQQLLSISTQLYDEINQAWVDVPIFDEPLVYRVSATADGLIVGYRGESDTADTYVDETPLPKLLYKPTGDNALQDQALAQFRVVFTPASILEVSPWYGYPESQTESQTTSQADSEPQAEISAEPAVPSSEANAAPAAATATVLPSTPGPGDVTTDSSRSLEDLARAVYTEIDQRWKTEPDFDEDIVYRIEVNQAGAILAAEPVTSVASQTRQELPITSLVQPSAQAVKPQTFRVVFKPSGVLEVSPWEGWE